MAEHADARYAELRMLAERHRSGHVSDREFRRDKRRILAASTDDHPTESRLEMFIAIYRDPRAAERALNHLRTLQDNADLQIIGAAAVIRDGSGHLHALEMHDLSRDISVCAEGDHDWPASDADPELGRLSELDHSLRGWTAGHFRSDDLATLGEDLEPGQSAFVAVVQNLRPERVSIGMRGYGEIAREAQRAELTKVVALVDRPDADHQHEDHP